MRALPTAPYEHYPPTTWPAVCAAPAGNERRLRGDKKKIMNVLPGMRRGPKPKGWEKTSKAGFEAFFARRSEPLNIAPDEAPLTEATGAGLRWIFHGFDDAASQVRATEGAAVRNVIKCVTGALVMLGCGQNPGEGTCERYWVLNELEVPEGTQFAQPRIRGGTGDLQLRLSGGEVAWYTSHHCRPWSTADDDGTHPTSARPTSPAPPLHPDASAEPPPSPREPPPPRAPPPRAPSEPHLSPSPSPTEHMQSGPTQGQPALACACPLLHVCHPSADFVRHFRLRFGGSASHD